MEEGETNTRYSFVKLEQAQSNRKIMDRIKKGDGQVTTDEWETVKCVSVLTSLSFDLLP